MSTPPALELVIRELRITDMELLRPALWDDSMRSMPAEALPFLTPAHVQAAGAYCQLEPAMLEALRVCAAKMAGDAALRALAWHAHRVAYVHEKCIANWPDLKSVLGDHAGLFHALVLLSGWPAVQALHEREGIEADVVRQTMRDVLRFMRRYRERRRVCWGVTPLDVGGWLMHHMRGRLYRIGRLQYIAQRAGSAYAIYRHRESGRVLALAGGGLMCDQRGWIQADGADGDAWTPTFSEDHDAIIGHPVDPAAASVQREPVRLPTAQWERTLQPDDVLLDLHIPDDGPMTLQACLSSLTAALAFWESHFPDSPPRGFVCTSWLMDPQLEAYLSPTSNLVQVLRQFYLMPAKCDPWAIFRFVFELDIPYGQAKPTLPWSRLPRATSLQRALLDHVEAGGQWRKVKGLLLREHLAQWGGQVYRAHAAEQVNEKP